MQTHIIERSLRDDAPLLQQYRVRREPQHFLELVTHIDHRDRKLVAQPFEIRQHFFAPREVQRRERLIEQ